MALDDFNPMAAAAAIWTRNNSLTSTTNGFRACRKDRSRWKSFQTPNWSTARPTTKTTTLFPWAMRSRR